MPSLTEREIEVLKLASEGNTDKSIASQLAISKGTIGNYWTRIRLKLGASSRTEAVSLFKQFKTDELQAEGEQLLAELKQQKSIEEELRLSHSELESLIEERTSELLVMNEQLREEISRRNQTEQALSSSERRYQNLYDLAEVGMFRSRIDGSEMLEVNEKFLQTLEGTRDDFLGQPSVKIWASPQEREDVVRQILRDGQIIDHECQLRTVAGDIKICLLSSKLYRQEGIVEGSIIDLTDRKIAEAELQKSESQLRAIIDSIPDPAWMKDHSGIYLAVNSAWSRFTGIDRSEAVGKSDFDIHPDESAIIHLERDQQVITSSKAIQYEEFVKGDPEDAWFETVKTPVVGPRGEVVAIAGIARHITERKRKESHQQEAMQFAMGVIDGITSHVAVVDRSGVILAVNKAWRDFAAQNQMPNSHDCVGDNYLDICVRATGPESGDAKLVGEGILEVIGGARQVFELEYRCDGPDVERWFLLRVTPFPGAAGNMVVIEHENISALKENERRLELINERYQNFISQSHESVSCIEFSEPVDTHLPIDEQVDLILQRAYLGESNQAMAVMFGLEKPLSTAEGHISNIDWGYDPESIRNDVKVFIREGYQRIDWEAYRKTSDGRSIYTLSNHKGIVEDGKLTRIWITTTDISDRRRAEEETARSYSLLKAALESTVDGLLITDCNGGVVRWNQKFADMWRIPVEILESREEQQALDFVRAQLVEPDHFMGNVSEIYHAPERSSFDQLRFKDGRVFERYSQPQMVGDRVVGRVWSFRDVTEHMLAENALRESEHRFKTAFKTSPDAININRLPDGLYIEVNEGFTQLTGYHPEEVIGRSSLDLGMWVDPHDRERLVEGLKADGFVSNLEFQYRAKSGSLGYALMSARMISINNEPCILSISRDISRRKRAHDVIRESEERFSNAFTNAPIGVGLVGLDGTWLKVNRSLCAIVGYNEEELTSLKFQDITHPDDLEDDLEYGRQLLAGEIKAFRMDKRYLHRDGHDVWVTLSVSLVRDSKNQPLYFISQVQDVSDRKKAEEALRESESRFRAITANTPDHILVQDLDLRYQLVVNPQMGLTEQDMLDKTDFDLFSKEDAETLTRIKREVLATGQSINVEVPLTRPDGGIEIFNGTYVPKYDADGVVKGLMGYFRNVTALQQGIAALQEANDRLDQTHVAAGAGSWEWDLRSGCLTWSDRLYELFGLDRTTATPSFDTWQSVMHPEDWASAQRNLTAALESHTKLENEYRIILPDRRERWISAIGMAAYDDQGQPTHMRGMCIDITTKTNAVYRQLMAVEVLKILNSNDTAHDSLEQLLKTIQRYTGYDAVAIRLKEGSDFPYYLCDGFSPEFIKNENYLCCWSQGKVELDDDGKPILECTCGLVLSGKTDPTNALFTPFGSAWINHSEDLLAVPRDQDPRNNPRNRCIHEGYHSVALIPIRLGDEIVGLLQLNDHQPDCFDEELIQYFEGIGTSIGIALSRRKNADKLAESEQRIRALFESISVGIVLFDAETLRFTIFNDAAPAILGYSTEEYAGLGVLDIEAENDEELIRQNVYNALNGEMMDFETVHRAKNGELKNIDVRASGLELDGQQVILAIYSDITHRKKLQDALAESDRSHRKVLESLPDIILRYDAEGRHLFVSENVSDVVDFKAREFIGKTHRDLGFPEHMCQLWEDGIQRVFRTGEVYETEFCLDSKLGERVFNWRLVPELDSTGTVASVLSISRDMTAHRKAEHDFSMLFQEMLDGFALHEMICDERGKPVDYRFLAVNPAFERLTHLDAASIIGKTVLEVMPDTEPIWIERYGQVALTGEPSFFDDYSQALGKYFEVSAFQPAPMQFACIFVDVTEQIQATQALQQAHDELEQKVAERTAQLEIANSELESFSYSVSHDLRAPLRTLGGFSKIMLTDYTDKLDDDGQFYLERISTTVDTMSELIDGLLRLSRINRIELNRKSVNLSLMIQQIADASIEADPDRAIQFKIQENVWADADEALIRSLLENLVGNACKYTGKKKQATVEFRSYKEEGKTVYEIKDNGAGFDMAFSNKLFGTFQRLHNEREFPGIGIGLATVRRIVRRHDGNVWAQGQVGKGASFFFTLGS